MARKRMILWRGISAIDNATPVVVVATFDTRHGHESDNTKTGNMVQVYIIRDDMHPVEAIKTGADTAICGDCPHRSKASGGSGACYVQVGKAPASIWRALQRDGKRVNRKTGQPTTVGDSIAFDPAMLAGRKIRFGAYGDPAVAPLSLWVQLAAVSAGWTGYTHRWSKISGAWQKFFMASTDTAVERDTAKKAGWLNFTVYAAGTEKPAGAVVCPASVEAGKKTVCADCLRCGGTSVGRRGRDVAIIAHGASKKSFGRSLPLSVVSR